MVDTQDVIYKDVDIVDVTDVMLQRLDPSLADKPVASIAPSRITVGLIVTDRIEGNPSRRPMDPPESTADQDARDARRTKDQHMGWIGPVLGG